MPVGACNAPSACPPLSHAAALPQDAAAWAELQYIQLCWAKSFLWASHVCSYACALSQYAPAEAAAFNMCWLSQQPAGSAGSQCATWPTDYPAPTIT